jgi:hypothetical protein
MLRFLLLFTFLFGLALPLLGQDLFPCRDQQGRLFVTDNPSKLPAGCVLLGPGPSAGSLSVVAPAEPVSPGARGAMAALSRLEQRRQALEELWRRQAETLVQRYQAEVRDIYEAGRSSNRRIARQDLELIREQKRVLLADVRKNGRQAILQELTATLEAIKDS